jgi:hypothetical protein
VSTRARRDPCHRIGRVKPGQRHNILAVRYARAIKRALCGHAGRHTVDSRRPHRLVHHPCCRALSGSTPCYDCVLNALFLAP